MKDSNTTKHSIEILRAALPHLNNAAKKPIELVVQANELFENISTFQNTDELSACSTDNSPVDVESLLTNIQDVCNDSEKELIHMILSFLQTRKIYQAYDSFRSANQANSKLSGSGQPNMMEFLMSQLPPEQKSTFETMSMMLNAMNV